MPERHDFGRVRPRHKQVPIPNRDEHPWRYRWAVFRWRVALLTVTHTVGLAMAVSFLIASIPAWLILAQAKHTTALTREVQTQRQVTTELICDKVGEQANAVNSEAKYIEALIVAGAEQSRVFEPLYRQYGQPPYAERVAKAKRQAAKLDSLTVRPLDCKAFTRQIVELKRRLK